VTDVEDDLKIPLRAGSSVGGGSGSEGPGLSERCVLSVSE
jgi:hypothetical protein